LLPSENKKCKRFNAATKQLGRGAEAIDCFTQNWHGTINYVMCPFQLIGRVLKHVEECCAETVIVVPNWNLNHGGKN
jgi:mRNA deadenylase 3'-5' endonuclease subunit Ccr4